MKNDLTKVIAVLMVAGLMATGPVAYAEYEGDNPDGGKGYKHGDGKDFFKELNLTEEQRAKLKAQRASKKESVRAVRDQMKVKMRALHDTISKPETKRADVDGLVAEVNTLKGQMFSQMIDGVFAMKEVLTPEQFAKMQAAHQERMDKKPEAWGRHQKGAETVPPQPEKA